MDAVGASGSELAVEALLARFPGPIVLRAPRGRAIRGFAWHALLAGVFVWVCATLEQGDWAFWALIGVASWEALLAAIWALQLAKIDSLRLDFEGISKRVLLMERRYRWISVSRFAPRSGWLFWDVVASRADGALVLTAAAAGLSPANLATLLTRWRERALT